MEDQAKTSIADEKTPMADELLDDLLPENLDWRDLVRSHPLPALLVSGVAGFLLGRHHGTAILEALSDFASREVDRNVSALFGDDRS